MGPLGFSVDQLMELAGEPQWSSVGRGGCVGTHAQAPHSSVGGACSRCPCLHLPAHPPAGSAAVLCMLRRPERRLLAGGRVPSDQPPARPRARRPGQQRRRRPGGWQAPAPLWLHCAGGSAQLAEGGVGAVLAATASLAAAWPDGAAVAHPVTPSRSPACSCLDAQVCYPKPTDRALYHGLVTQCKGLGIPFVSMEEVRRRLQTCSQLPARGSPRHAWTSPASTKLPAAETCWPALTTCSSKAVHCPGATMLSLMRCSVSASRAHPGLLLTACYGCGRRTQEAGAGKGQGVGAGA
jgi:hypothetical protein